jgi:mRNA-degrading endonuclease RelE of RelBE toxin-antitoxin system
LSLRKPLGANSPRLPAKVKINALEKIQLLRPDLTRYGVQKLSGNEYYSTRFFGNHYRIVFRLFAERHLVLITRVRHRSDADRGL